MGLRWSGVDGRSGGSGGVGGRGMVWGGFWGVKRVKTWIWMVSNEARIFEGSERLVCANDRKSGGKDMQWTRSGKWETMGNPSSYCGFSSRILGGWKVVRLIAGIVDWFASISLSAQISKI